MKNVAMLGALVCMVLSQIDRAQGAAAYGESKTLSVDELSHLSLEDLLEVRVTTASKISERVDEAPSTIYVITEEQIKRLGLRDLKDILALVPGVDVVHPHFFLEGGQRGFVGSFSKTLLLVNGREMNNLIAGETFISNQFRAGNIRQVEIINGPGSALYGANAMAGVINVITKTAGGFEGIETSVLIGSHETEEFNVLLGGKQGDFTMNGSVSYYQSAGEDFSGFLSNTERASPAAENNAYRNLPNTFGYDGDEEALWISFYLENKGVYYGSEFYRNVTARGTSGIQWDYTQGEDQRELWLHYFGYKKEGLLDGRLDAKAEYRYYWEQFWGNHTESEGPIENPFTEKVTTSDTTPGDVEAFRGFYSNRRGDDSQKHWVNLETTYRVSDENTLVTGLDVQHADIVGAAWSRTNGVHPAITGVQRQPEFSNYKWGVYLQDQARLFDERLLVTLGARFDDHEIYGDTVNPRGGLVYKLAEKTILKFLYGEAFREPTVFELNNSTDIRPTELQAYELGWHQQLGRHVKNEAVIFYNQADDVIVADSTEKGGISNKGELDAEGFENVLSFAVGSLNGFLNYTYTTAELDEPQRGRRTVTDIPKHKVNLAAMYEFVPDHSLGLVTRFRSDVDTEYRDQRIEIDDYVVVDLTYRLLRVPWFDADATLDIIAKNILDEDYFHPEPRAPSVVKHPQDERGVFVKLTIRI